ncbi:HAD family hydrolase, partial [bacterium]|nr:HAD family hydrolase [bacterium]
MSAFIKTEALVFDWGNTVMKEFAEFHGAMVDWPRVEAMPGVVQALKELQPRFHLFLGSNAQNSGADQIKRALKRVNLEGFFEAIFTFNETKARKPEIGFYRAIEQLTACSSSHMVMIGDLYDKDICGAKQAGWKAVWYNPGCAPCTGCMPMHDIELYDMKALPAALKEPTYPGVETCLLW